MCLFLINVLISVQKKQNTFISSKQEPRHLRCSASVNISRHNSTTAEDDLSHTHTHTVSDFTDYQRKHLMNAWTHCRCLTCLHIFTRNSTQVSLEEQQQTRRWARNADQKLHPHSRSEPPPEIHLMWRDDEIPADAAVRPASAAGAPPGDFKMICLDRQVRGRHLSGVQQSFSQGSRGKLMMPWWNLKGGYFGKHN